MSNLAIPSLTQQDHQNVAKINEIEDCPGKERLDPRVRRTRKLLMDSLRMLLAERDYAEISIGDIAERATVNRATFYAHYTDKQDLLAGMLRQEFEDLIFTRLFPGVPFRTENVVALSVVVFQFMGSLLGGCAKKASELGPLASPIVQETLCVHIKKWLEVDPDAMTYFSGASRSAVAGALSWSIYGGALEWSRLAHRKPADKASKEIVSLFLR